MSRTHQPGQAIFRAVLPEGHRVETVPRAVELFAKPDVENDGHDRVDAVLRKLVRH